MKKPVIQFTRFSFQYHAQSEPTLHEIDLTIYEGEKVLIVGPSGSGKSTLGHCLNGLAPFFYPGEIKGSLKVMDKETKQLGIYELSELVGTVLQDPDGQFVGMTVAEDIAFKLENDAVPQQRMMELVVDAARLAGIDTHLQSAPHALSGGQKQRTTLAGVLVNDVGILLFDEPLANLDPAAGKTAVELIDRIRQQSDKTIVMIEHRLEDVLHRSVDRIIMMDNGRIAADMRPADLLSSDLLRQIGIREPLYITALKYAGCRIEPDMHPEHIETIDLNRCRDSMKAWYEEFRTEQVVHDPSVLLELQNVDFGYEPDKLILHNISFRIGRGEMISIVGKNGAGKSTLSKMICGFYRTTEGRLLYDGRDMAGDTIKERSARIGYVMQNPNQMISKTMLYDEVAFGLVVQGMADDQIRDRVHDVLHVCGLYEFRNWPISALSYGQKKRVTIASILVLQPEMLILDEPTAGQDFQHYSDIMEFLQSLNRSGMTIVMITHDMHLMLEYADRTIVLADGRVIADDRPEKVLSDPEIVRAAHLKETSIYELALRVGLYDPEKYVRTFIAYDRRNRGN